VIACGTYWHLILIIQSKAFGGNFYPKVEVIFCIYTHIIDECKKSRPDNLKPLLGTAGISAGAFRVKYTHKVG
jgi:hypothetical protein